MPSTGPKISPRNCAALRAAEAAGIEIVIPRPQAGLRYAPDRPGGPERESVMISSNGAVVRGFDGVAGSPFSARRDRPGALLRCAATAPWCSPSTAKERAPW